MPNTHNDLDVSVHVNRKGRDGKNGEWKVRTERKGKCKEGKKQEERWEMGAGKDSR